LPLFATAQFTKCRKKLLFRLFASPATGAHRGNRYVNLKGGGNIIQAKKPRQKKTDSQKAGRKKEIAVKAVSKAPGKPGLFHFSLFF
jgi:hypothetical protein